MFPEHNRADQFLLIDVDATDFCHWSFAYLDHDHTTSLITSVFRPVHPTRKGAIHRPTIQVWSV